MDGEGRQPGAVDPGVVDVVLKAGAYGTAMVFFVYGAYVLQHASTAAAGRNARWYMGLGALVVVAMLGLDVARMMLMEPEGPAPTITLYFSPLPSQNDLPDPVIQYQSRTMAVQDAIEIGQDGSSILISLDGIIRKVKDLQTATRLLSEQSVGAVLSTLSEDFGERVAAAQGATCREGDASCGGRLLSEGDIASAEKALAAAGAEGAAGDTGDRAVAWQGLGELYPGQGRIEDAQVAFKRSEALGNAGAQDRLRRLERVGVQR